MKQFIINLIGSIIIIFALIYDFIFDKDIKKLDNVDPTNTYNPEDL